MADEDQIGVSTGEAANAAHMQGISDNTAQAGHDACETDRGNAERIAPWAI